MAFILLTPELSSECVRKCRKGDGNGQFHWIFEFISWFLRKQKKNSPKILKFLKQTETTPCWIDKICQKCAVHKNFFIDIHKKNVIFSSLFGCCLFFINTSYIKHQYCMQHESSMKRHNLYLSMSAGVCTWLCYLSVVHICNSMATKLYYIHVILWSVCTDASFDVVPHIGMSSLTFLKSHLNGNCVDDIKQKR